MRVIQSIPRDSIPSIDDPEFVDDYFGEPEDDLIVLTQAEQARAYPTRILNYHEVVNDTLDGTPVVVTWCPLCGSAVVFARTIGERTLTIGVSGKLADDNLVLFDRETGSEWKQSTGDCLAGEHEGESLDLLPATVTTWERYRTAYPDGLVLDPPGGRSISSGTDRSGNEIDYAENPFAEYLRTDAVGRDAFYDIIGRDPDEHYQEPRSPETGDVGPKELVLGIEVDDDVLGIPESRFGTGVVTTTVGDREIVAFDTPAGYHAFKHPGFNFEQTDTPTAFAGDGARWSGVTGESDDGRTLSPVPSRLVFAFVWQDDYGPASFYEP